MGKLARRDIVGTGSAAIAINSVATISICNLGAANAAYEVKIRRVDNTLHTISKGFIAPDSDALTLESVSVYAGEYIVLTAPATVSAAVSLLQETTTASGSLSRDEIEHTGDGVQTTFALPANAPANNKKELTVWVHGVAVSPSLYDLDATKTNIVFTTSIFSGAEIVVRLWKTEA